MTPKHYSDESHAHYLTFSCYHNLPLFKDNVIYGLFLQSLDAARNHGLFRLYGFVVMPNHVHLMTFPQNNTSLSAILTAVKQPFSYRGLNWLGRNWPEIYSHLTVKKGNRMLRRFWQAGGGYDRNVFKDETFIRSLEYMHYNPVRKGLVQSPLEWKWSSARFYETGEIDLIKIDYPEWW